MIGTFWNMCRACPSLPLNSEYRSTYRWHEYKGSNRDDVVVRRPPQPFISENLQEPALPRRKKHPEIAYKTNDFLNDSGSEALLGNYFLSDRARSEERWASCRNKNSRRSKSEGPHARKSSYRLISTRSINIPNQSSIFTKIRDSNKKYDKKATVNTTTFTNRNNIIQSEILKTVPPKKEDNNNKVKQVISSLVNPRIDDILSDNQPKKSVSMNGIKNKSDHDSLKGNSETDNLIGDDSGSKHDDTDGEFKSEYKKNFQPFNKYDFDEQKGVFERRPTVNAFNSTTESDLPSSSWYKEVVLLRQKANQYRHRGWGTELIPDHIAQLYNDQMMVWEQVSRRSTLSALSLATTVSSRNESSKEEKENKKNSPLKSLTRAKSAKGSHHLPGTHQGKPDKKKTAPTPKQNLESSPKKGNVQMKKLYVKRTSPNRTRQESNVGAPPPTIHKSLIQEPEKSKRRSRPTSLITTVPSGAKASQLKKDRKGDEGDEEFTTALEPEQIIKSPPEPTRVKSPEQIVIRSPEPVNWTVPLDTGKTFTVTQNIREGDLAPRSYSEVRAWTPGNVPPPASISAPTELAKVNVNNQGEILSK
ncbi:hypothetical protein Phum_PHUM032360 [Pediculus humanus corporis]|uniref:Nuclear protein MDM1 n=1 Tax=Pediculus humanus subsp. corporis TaxID=121224 RepID=E0VA96_PEDHC|nr:uncharacterized protein Phum_PHUM032360 [Pediculus humanus corporis]EEB10302.1 hypothetical protein Phum_PHUM032360 [Pediculus humanus corporis]